MATNQLELTPAMEAYLIALIYRNTRTSCLSLSAVCAHVSHDRLQRMLYQKFAWSRRLWDLFAARMVREGGYLIIDDTTWARWAQHSEAVSWVWSSTHGRVLRGHQVVLLIWTDGEVRVQIKDRKSTRLNSSHLVISYAVFCLKKKHNSRLRASGIRRAVRGPREQEAPPQGVVR